MLVQGSNIVVTISTLVSKVDVIVHAEINDHATKVDSNFHFGRNMVVHYKQENMEYDVFLLISHIY